MLNEQYSGQDTLPLYSGIRAGEPEYHLQSQLISYLIFLELDNCWCSACRAAASSTASCRFKLPCGKDDLEPAPVFTSRRRFWRTTLRRSSALTRCLALELGIDPNMISKLGVFH